MKKILIILIALFIVLQFFTIDKTNPPAEPNKDFITITNPPTEIGNMIIASCYDCHSHNTKYPWYSNIAPASWLLKNHINDGRRHLNFSIWPDYQEAKKADKIGECIELVESGDMPMKAYILMHSEAAISDEQREKLTSWFKSIKDNL